jgi:hypothetical protein
MGRVNANTASHPVLLAATEGNPSFTAAIIRSRPYIVDLAQGQLGSEALMSTLSKYGGDTPVWVSNYANILGVRSNAFTAVAEGKVARLDGKALAARRVEALIDRTDDKDRDGAAEVAIKYLRYEPQQQRTR